jgi:hypothetical protein
MSSNVVGFEGARAAAYAKELQWLEAGFANNLKNIGAWPARWFETGADQRFAIDQSMRIATKLYLERCITAARKYGADADYFQATLRNYPGDTEEMWGVVDRLITCGCDD